MLPAIQWVLNMAHRERCANTPYHVMFGRAPLTSFSTLASSTGEDWKVDALDEERDFYGGKRTMLCRRSNDCTRQRQAASREQLPNFAVGDYGKGTAAGLDAEVGEHVDRSLAICTGG